MTRRGEGYPSGPGTGRKIDVPTGPAPGSRRKMTSPLVLSAPLPSEWSLVGVPVESLLTDEARRAAMELVWALHQQRTAWAKFAKVKQELDDRNITYVDNERVYTLASGDVKWWRAEVSSRANALTALLAAAQFFYPDVDD